jgi:hypothetical protein
VTAVRSLTRAALVRAVALELPGVAVDRSWPGRNLKKDHVYVDRTEGQGSFPLIEPGEHEREDEFRILVQCQASRPGRTSEKAEEECERFMTAVLTAAARAQLAGGLLDLEWLSMVEPGETNGPDAEPTKEGFVAFGQVEIQFTARVLPGD